MKTVTDLPSAVALTTLLAPISWGTTYWVVTELMPVDRPLLIAAVRVVPAGLLLVAIGLLSSGWRPRGREWQHVAVLSLANFGLFMPLLVAATYRVPGGVIASFAGLQPLLVILGTWLITRSAPRRIDLAISVGAALGVVLVVGGPTGALDPLGLALALGANISFAAGVILTKRLPTPSDRVAHTGWQLLLSGLVIVPLALLFEGVPSSVNGLNLIGFVYLGIVATGVASVLWFRGIDRLPVQAPPLLGLASAVTGVVIGWVVLGQSLTLPQSVGFLITVGAIAYGATVRQAVGNDAADEPRLQVVQERDVPSGLSTDSLPLMQVGADHRHAMQETAQRPASGVGLLQPMQATAASGPGSEGHRQAPNAARPQPIATRTPPAEVPRPAL